MLIVGCGIGGTRVCSEMRLHCGAHICRMDLQCSVDIFEIDVHLKWIVRHEV